MSRATLALVVLAVALVHSASTAAAMANASECMDWCTDQDKITARMSGVDFVLVRGRPDPKQYQYTGNCPENYMTRIPDLCLDGGIPEPPEACESGVMVAPRWAQLRDDGTGNPGPWVLEAGYSCPGDRDYPIAYDDFAQLPIAPSPLELQPNTGWVYAGLDTIGYTDDASQGFEVQLRGGTFLVGAIPFEYSWDFGDGSDPITTTDPGKPWPDHTVAHQYTAGGVVTPVLTTRWKGVFRTGATGPWHEIDGTGETTTTGGPVTVHTARTRLVEDDLG